MKATGERSEAQELETATGAQKHQLRRKGLEITRLGFRIKDHRMCPWQR
jgi:hypothetical protein